LRDQQQLIRERSGRFRESCAFLRQYGRESFGFCLEEFEVHDLSSPEGKDVGPLSLELYAARSALSRDLDRDDDLFPDHDRIFGPELGFRPCFLQALPLLANFLMAPVDAAVGAARF
jgi:hypothetical protein